VHLSVVIAAAYHLGAEYDKFDNFSEDFFSKYLLLSHGVRYGAEEGEGRRKSIRYRSYVSLLAFSILALVASPLSLSIFIFSSLGLVVP